ncbi:cysteine desulfurase family protein [Candidatus Vidania fulgoroideorum]
MNLIYLDNASTTKISKYVLNKIIKSFKIYNNSFSITFNKNKSQNLIKKCKKKLSNILNCDYNEIFFTSGTTESNNITIRGIVDNKFIIITSKIEHSSIFNTIKVTKSKKIFIKNKNGFYCIDDIKKKIENFENKKILLSLTWINNETGIVQNIKKIYNICKKYNNILLHVDASQAIGKIIINLKNIKIDFLSFSSHKIHGPVGIGCLYIRKKNIKKIKPILFGGDQEKNIRPGTLPLQLIIGATYAIEYYYKNFYKNKKKIKILYYYFIKKIKGLNYININGNNKYSNIINIYIKNINRNYLFYKLKKFIFSFNSTCSKKNPYRILKNMGLKKKIYKNSIRISFSKYNTKKEINIFVKKITNTYSFCKKYFL